MPEAALDNWQPVWNAQVSISTPVCVNFELRWRLWNAFFVHNTLKIKYLLSLGQETISTETSDTWPFNNKIMLRFDFIKMDNVFKNQLDLKDSCHVLSWPLHHTYGFSFDIPNLGSCQCPWHQITHTYKKTSLLSCNFSWHDVSTQDWIMMTIILPIFSTAIYSLKSGLFDSISLKFVSSGPTDNVSVLIHVLIGYHQAPSHYRKQWWPS